MSSEFEREYSTYVNSQKKIKEKTAEEAKCVIRQLTRSDAILLSAFLGYLKIKQIAQSPLKSKDAAPSYVFECLFKFEKNQNDNLSNDKPNNDNDNHGDKNDKHQRLSSPSVPTAAVGDVEFDLIWLMDKSPTSSNLPRLFKKETMDELIQLFTDGATLDETNQCAVVRMFQVSKKMKNKNGDGRTDEPTD